MTKKRERYITFKELLKICKRLPKKISHAYDWNATTTKIKRDAFQIASQRRMKNERPR
jgi:uncharacterized membrane protein